MSSFDKIVKLACKPKNAPPKSKYIDAIIAATWSEDGAVHDVCKALSPRFREPNSVVVFKALIVLHTMIRNGATDNILAHLSQSDILKLRNVYLGTWEGFENPDHLHHYARYLDCRIRAYRDLKHDVIKVQSETNRDMRNSTTLEDEEQGYRNKKKQGNNASLGRSKTLMGRKLRSMTVEKGLLRETKAVHQMIDALVGCRFYMDGVDDELRLTALRMLVKDLLILFQAGNEAVINLLEQYFEMSHIDAAEALSIYRHFCKEMEHVTEYLGVAKKLQNLLNVPIPNLRHAPLSLATALQEYLDDPNFEQNRLEYKANRAAVDGKAPKSSATKAAPSSKLETNPLPSTSRAPEQTTSVSSSSAPQQQKSNVDDFFSSIEDNQTNMFNQASSPTNFAPQAAPNPFSQMMTGQPFVVPQINTQPTGFLMPQHTVMPNAANPFGIPRQQPATAPGPRPFSTFVPSPDQQNFLQPQATGVNPFRQSMLVPQTTGMALFGVGGGGPGMGMGMGSPTQQPNSNPFPGPSQPMQSMATGFGQSLFNTASSPQQSQQLPQQSFQQSFQPMPTSVSMMPSNSAFSTTTQTQTTLNVPQRPASTPLTAIGSTAKSASPPPAKPLRPHMTGTRNPFGPIIEPAPPVPKPPTLAELTMGFGGAGSTPSGSTQSQQQSQVNGGATSAGASTGGFNFANSALNPGGTDMGSVASSFAFSNAKPAGTAATSPTSTSTATGPTFSDSLFGGPSANTGVGNANASAIAATASLPTGVGSGFGTGPAPALKPQMTGFAGLKPFKPTSSFGAALMDSLPAAPNSSGTGSSTGTTGPGAAGAGVTGASTIGPGTTGAGTSSFGTSEFGTWNKPQQTGFGGSLGGLGALNAGANATSPPTTAFANASSPRTTSPTGFGAAGMGSRLGSGLRPQITGGGAANPFRASMAAGNSLGGFGSAAPSVPPLPTGFGNGSMFGSMSGMGQFGAQQGVQQPGGQQQAQGSASLI
ncbi:ANTH-domain-containing protein [Macrolepiota fuliginosa MF-IS2]|uniref:ANTH-domain-containing protein n=1 Tax=Macrolepiota fuliginosa MF-IS2 TaxID=1400762 RepID=A0A9P5XAS1_9AGAR|nr:ANTH-domain-containing protein [Macrolepiota fuliginosa MF-IS2]